MCNMYFSFNKKIEVTKNMGFTLSEVMLVLSVIGVISAFTIPTLVNQMSEKKLAVQVKKKYSLFQQMVMASRSDGDGGLQLLFDPSQTSVQTLNAMSKYLKIIKICPNKACWTQVTKYAKPRNDGYGNYSGTFNGLSATGVMADGATISVGQFGGSSDCVKTLSDYQKDADGNYILDANGDRIPISFIHKNCADLAFDVNGPNPPNQFGADTFFMVATVDSIKPYTTAYYGDMNLLLKNGELTNTSYDPATYKKE